MSSTRVGYSQNLTLAAGHLTQTQGIIHPDRHKDVPRMPKSGRVSPHLKKRSLLSTEGFVMASAGHFERAGSEMLDSSQTKGGQTQVSTVRSELAKWGQSLSSAVCIAAPDAQILPRTPCWSKSGHNSPPLPCGFCPPPSLPIQPLKTHSHAYLKAHRSHTLASV